MEKRYPLSKTEEGIYVSCLKKTDAYNVANVLNLGKDLDVIKLKDAINKVFDAHPYLFTVLHQDDDGKIYKSIEKENVNIEYYEVTKLDLKPYLFELLDNHLYHLAIYKYNDEYYFLFDFHHIIFDGTSFKLFMEDVINAYEERNILKEEYDANDLALDEEKLLKSNEYINAKNYYEKMILDTEVDSTIVYDKSLKDVIYKNYNVKLNIKDEDIKKLTHKLNIKTSSFHLACFSYLISKMNMDDKSLFLTVNNGRTDLIKKSYGMFVKTYPFYLEHEETVNEYLLKANEEQINNIKNLLYPFSSLVKDLGITANILFAYQGDYFYKTKLKGKDVYALPIERKDGKENISIELHRDNGSYIIWVEYRADLYNDETIETLVNLFDQVEKEFLIKEKLSDINLISESSLKLLNKFNDVDSSYINYNNTILDSFKNCVKNYPDNYAVSFKDKKYSYKEVDLLSNKLGNELISYGIKKEDVVSILIKKSEYIVIASLGVIKSGAAYQPLDPTYPEERLNFMVKDSSAKVLILDRDLDSIIDFNGKKIYVDEISNLKNDKDTNIKLNPNDLFIMLYTSGSTGLPKGVMLEHGNINTFVSYYNKAYDVKPTSRMAAYASYGFDADMMDLYPALTSGACVYVIPEELRLDLVKLGEFYNENKITHSLITTQVGRQFASEIDVKYLKHFFVGGEKLVPIEPPKNYIFHNVYGPTEGTVFCTDKIVDKLYFRVPIGANLNTYKFYVLDKYKNILPPLVTGELYIAGPQVARGYLNREKENKEAFLINSFDDDPLYKRLYKTGDIVRLLPNGEIDFIGRKDGQVKIRGFRVELTEVEKVIREYPGINDATVKDFLDPAGVKFICAYIVSDKLIDIQDLNKFISSKKPPYMVPAYTMQIDKIPLNQNQKVNKKALPLPELKIEDIVMPENDLEKEIYDILKDVLGHESFGTKTNLYEAGLTSVSSIRLTIKLSKKFNCDVSNEDLVNNPTIKELIKALKNKDIENEYEIKNAYPITKTQEGIFVESISHPGTTNYNIPFLFKLSKDINLNKLEEAIIKTIDNHPYLKTKLFMDDEGNILAKRENLKTIIEKKKIKNLDYKSLIKPFDLLNDQLYRIEIIESDSNYLFLDFHHIICDGTSEAIILSDINNAYLGKKLTKEDFTGFEVALKEADLFKTDKLAKAKDFYKEILKDVDGEYLIKKDLKTSDVSKLKSNDFIIDLDINALKKFIEDNKLTLNSYFNFAFAFTLSKYLYKNDALYVTIYNGRNSSKLENTVSMLVKTLPVFIKYDEEDNIINKLKEMKDLLINLQANDLYPFSSIKRDYDITAEVMFAYQGDSFNFNEIGGKKVETILLESDTPKSQFGLDVFLDNNKFRLHFEWDEAIFNDETIKSFKRLYELVLNELMVKDKIKNINTLPKEDLELYNKFNSSKEEIPNITINKLIEKQAKLKPNKDAVIGIDKKYNYKEFNEACNKVAHFLVDNGVKFEDKIVMMMPRIADAYVVRQGIIKSGGAFVPIDPKYPIDRIEYIITNSDSKILIATKNIIDEKKKLFKDTNIKAFAIEDILKSDKIDNLDLDIPQSNLAYMIYTSGSTGKPKGVMISHHNLVNYVLDGSNIGTSLYRNIPNDGAIGCSFASFSFDASLQEECVPLTHGYTAVIASEEEIENPLKLASTLIKIKVNIMFMTPSFVSNFIDVKEFVDALRNFYVLDMGAEAVPAELCQKLKDLGVNAQIYNGYGPTETTITCTYHKVTDKYVTIGKPFANTEIYMLDKNGHILPINAIGDLTIAGDSVGIGYYKLPDRTEKAFINVMGKRAYRSGDLARYNSEGNIEFFGRLDNQVKLRGLRVELDEIEKVLNSYEGITRSIILVKTNNVDGDYLAAYFTANREIDKNDLVNHMAKSLTPYMVPKALMQLDRIPLTPNGKIDKKALPEIEVSKEKKNLKKPSNKLQEKILEIFKKALNNNDVGVDDDFFDLGGTSLSASKVAMLSVGANLPIAYKDIFEYSTVLELEEYINSLGGNENKNEEVIFNDLASLKENNLNNINDIKNERKLGTVLLTGATGFLGIHVLKELLEKNINVIALVRGSKLDPKSRLQALLAYYFDSPLDELLNKYVNVIDADITDLDKLEQLNKLKFDTIINCAACVKHFASSDIIERINVGGVLNLIKIAKKFKARLIQISTLSVAGENIDNKFDQYYKMKENMLSFGQDISNKYVNSKFKAEKAILEEIEKGLDAKIIRVGNLMGRNSDGEFQANSITNGFMRDLKGYATLHKFPVNSMDIEVDFSPIDEVAKTIILLATTNNKFTVFHSANSHMVQMGDIIYTMNELGYDIKVVSDNEFIEEMKKVMEDDKKNMLISSLISYSSSDNHTHSFIASDNEFTNKALYHLGYKWPITDENYLKKAIESLATLGFFERTDL